MAIREKHPVLVRWMHWVNFPLLLMMIWSGILIYWAYDPYPGFFPDRFYSFFNIERRLAEGIAVHFTLGWFFVLNGLAFALYSAGTGHWRELVPTRADLRQLVPFVLFDLKLSRIRVSPPTSGRARYNPAQKVAYTTVFLLGMLAVYSGFAIYKPIQLGFLTASLGGYRAARAIHFVTMLALGGFFVVHVLQVVRAGFNHARAMIVGFENE